MPTPFTAIMPSCHGGHCLGILGGEAGHGRDVQALSSMKPGWTLISSRDMYLYFAQHSTASGVGKQASCQRYATLRRMEEAVVAMLMVGQQKQRRNRSGRIV